MVRETVEQTIRCTPEKFLDLVMDPERYATFDRKLAAVGWVKRDGNVTQFEFRSRLPGVPGPAPKVVSQMTLTPGRRVDIQLAPVPANKLNRRISAFSASFVCTPAEGGTAVSRTIEMDFTPVLSWMLEPILRRTLRPDLEQELKGAKALLEQEPASPAA
jgi:hypothetical protein